MVKTALPIWGGVGSIPDWRPKILHAVWYNQNNEKIEYSFKFS